MRPTILLFAALWAGLAATGRLCGFDAAYDAGYAAIVLLAVLLSATFAWLWRVRATPIALGMAASWAGCAGLMAYWWGFERIGRAPMPGTDHQILWAFIALHLAGAASHLRVIAQAHGGGRALYAATLGAVAGSACLAALLLA